MGRDGAPGAYRPSSAKKPAPKPPAKKKAVVTKGRKAAA
jgi:hypothetical protein